MFSLKTLLLVCLSLYENLCTAFFLSLALTYEPAHDKTYIITYVASKDSDQPAHLPSMAMVLVYPSERGMRPVKTDQTKQMGRLI